MSLDKDLLFAIIIFIRFLPINLIYISNLDGFKFRWRQTEHPTPPAPLSPEVRTRTGAKILFFSQFEPLTEDFGFEFQKRFIKNLDVKQLCQRCSAVKSYCWPKWSPQNVTKKCPSFLYKVGNLTREKLKSAIESFRALLSSWLFATNR